ncbi:hypothetical protein QVD17_16465 [Tagetes erecta]|uniref:CCHC-type domain-containing protein n=1 Tax=Tagetes erecta TaxID=13708 RepID=A0AAD8NTK2_TARER|nr:hypothetical protein QVD17_16465 [Tagetes erecta]
MTTNVPSSSSVLPLVGNQVATTVANHAEKPEKLSGLHFKRWQQKMLFYLTTLNLARFLTEFPPKPAEKGADAQVVSALDAWKHSEFLCRNYVLNGLVDALYNLYCKTATAKELWESLERKYKTEDADTKKFVVALDFKMVDTKTVISQVLELQIILSDILIEGMVLSETFQVAAMVEKLPPSWVDFKNYLKHKRNEMIVDELVVRLRIEEDNRLALKESQVQSLAKTNMVEHGQSSKGHNGFKGKGKAKDVNLGPKKYAKKKDYDPFKGKCYNCGEHGHQVEKCKQPKRERAHVVEDDEMNMVAMIIEASTFIIEVNIAGEKSQGDGG